MKARAIQLQGVATFGGYDLNDIGLTMSKGLLSYYGEREEEIARRNNLYELREKQAEVNAERPRPSDKFPTVSRTS